MAFLRIDTTEGIFRYYLKIPILWIANQYIQQLWGKQGVASRACYSATNIDIIFTSELARKEEGKVRLEERGEGK